MTLNDLNLPTGVLPAFPRTMTVKVLRGSIRAFQTPLSVEPGWVICWSSSGDSLEGIRQDVLANICEECNVNLQTHKICLGWNPNKHGGVGGGVYSRVCDCCDPIESQL